MQKTQSSKFYTSLNSFLLSIRIGKGSSMLCLFSNLRPTPTHSKSVGIFILFNLMEGDSNLKLFDFGMQTKHTKTEGEECYSSVPKTYLKANFSVSLPEQPKSVFSSVVSIHFLFVGTYYKHPIASYTCHSFLFSFFF